MGGKPSSFGKIRHPKKRAFLAAMANTANVLRAAEIAGIDRDNHYLWLKKDPAYAAAFEIAWQRGTDALEAEAVRRAYEGVTKPIFRAGKRAIDVVQNPDGSLKRDELGKPIGIPAAVREYSDTLLIFLLKGRNPAVFGDRTGLEHSGAREHTTIVLNFAAGGGANPAAAGRSRRAQPALPQPRTIRTRTEKVLSAQPRQITQIGRSGRNPAPKEKGPPRRVAGRARREALGATG
jgi:hypothetical protein